jgi:hypothetical protein
MGGGKKAGVVIPGKGKFGVLKLMPERIGGPSIDKTLGNKVLVGSGLAEIETIKIPPEQFIPVTGGGYSL